MLRAALRELLILRGEQPHQLGDGVVEAVDDAFLERDDAVVLANLDMHPLDGLDRIPAIRNDFGSGYCNITKCCSDVCPNTSTGRG